MAFFTFLAALALWGSLLYLPFKSRRALLWLVLPGLPLSAAVNLLVKAPLIRAAAGALGLPLAIGQTLPWYWILFIALVPPITEELVKILPLVVPAVWRAVKGSRYAALWGGASLGMGFGLGEVLYLAYQIERSPLYAGLPWYFFTGFLSERLIVVLLHGVLTAFVLVGVQRGGKFTLIGLLGSMAGHLIINAGATAALLGWITPVDAFWALLAASGILLAVFARISRKLAPRDVARQDAQEVILYSARHDQN